ncbi:MAG TPA: mechanosensitive ion channel family protein [Micromonosporaceae bacterium]
MTKNSEFPQPAASVPHSRSAHEAFRAFESHVRPDFRKTIVFGALALALLITGHDIGGVHAHSAAVRLGAYGCALLVAIFGVAASRTAAREVQRFTTARAGAAAAAPLRIGVLLIGYLIAVISVCDLCAVHMGHLLIGGAITGIVVGLAAQPVLGNLFAGIVLLFARPYVPGQRIRVMAGAINGPHQGVIVSAGLLYTTLQTEDGPLNIPNSALMAAAVGPAEGQPERDDYESDASAGASAGDDQAQKSRDLATAIAESRAVSHEQP